jgi:DNA-directed RNA polymerase alpha subunit
MDNDEIMNMTLREIAQIITPACLLLLQRELADAKIKSMSLDVSVSVLKLATRPSNCLLNENIRTVRDLLTYSKRDLMRLPNFGRWSLQEVERELARHGWHLPNKRKFDLSVAYSPPKFPSSTAEVIHLPTAQDWRQP